MIFCELIEYHMRNIFLEKSYAKCGGDTCDKLSMSLDQYPNVLNSLFLLYAKFTTIEIKLLARCFYLK